MLGQRRRRWPNINPTLIQCLWEIPVIVNISSRTPYVSHSPPPPPVDWPDKFMQNNTATIYTGVRLSRCDAPCPAVYLS